MKSTRKLNNIAINKVDSANIKGGGWVSQGLCEQYYNFLGAGEYAKAAHIYSIGYVPYS